MEISTELQCAIRKGTAFILFVQILYSSHLQNHDVKPGELVALCCEKYNERPQIALVLKVDKKKIQVQWYDGSWTSKWKVYEYYLGRKKLTWEEEVDANQVIIRGIRLTPSGRLSSQTKDKLERIIIL